MRFHAARMEPEKSYIPNYIEIFENWIEGAVEMLGGVPVVCVDGLIRMKRKLGREKDLADIALIEKMRGAGRYESISDL